jgi:hypothetical protein
MIAAITAASEESGPSTITREGPKTAYASSGTIVAYSPVIGGSPAACAYPPASRSEGTKPTCCPRLERSPAP